MKKLFHLILVSGSLFPAIVSSQFVETRLEAILDSIYKANPKTIGILTHVEYPDRSISWSGAAGIADKETNEPAQPNQPALIASSIKTYVSATILVLVESGKLTIDQPINNLLSEKTRELYTEAGYELNLIAVKHLLSHTSGIEDYVNEKYMDFVDNNPTYRWTRDELLALALKEGKRLGALGSTFSYADVNYLLVTEIIEEITGKPFYTAMRELLKYDKFELNHTWFPTLEMKPAGTAPLVHQYYRKYNWNSYDLDVSWDLYGGGGIACTTEDLARFSYNLFNHKIIKDEDVLNQIYTKIYTNDSLQMDYYLGLAKGEFDGIIGYGHGGFWGTYVFYIPELNCSISIFILEKEQRDLYKEIMRVLINEFRN